MYVEEIMSRLKKLYPKGYFQINRDPYYLLISTVLSQRTRDEVTIPTTQKLFSVFDTPQKMANADVDEIQELIRDVGFYRVKSQRLIEISHMLLDEYDGIVPDDINELVKLPGVGRKTANCVLTYAFDKDAIAVDTHVHRISNRMGLVKTATPEETEIELEKVTEKGMWKDINGLMVLFGKSICRPVSPKCEKCIMNDICPKLI
ncbi:DNA-(apurinic or apyrimidinic site) lyase /endonuclease III [Methanococcoides vulcani]|uniref:Endonuclease III n=1 Tax=Methanococcoides vulcani TaxID=1353158 RepID=A0A1H9YHQ6_9EURY|nr:endonuclease III [Methanococcoides vulcani]SES68511.1 DNA-(apurinic or apyrimidinic site) lyase /endonuclease III [Methanococcoides vulcani]